MTRYVETAGISCLTKEQGHVNVLSVVIFGEELKKSQPRKSVIKRRLRRMRRIWHGGLSFSNLT